VSDDLSHLTPAAADLLQVPHDQRIRAILGERWVQYARAGQVLRILNLLLEHPRTTRMPSIAVYGDSGMGKTMIMQRFRAQHPPHFDSQAGIERTRVLALQLAGKPGKRRLYAQILTALGVPQNPRASVVELASRHSPYARYGCARLAARRGAQYPCRYLPGAAHRPQHAALH
jgi:hypothetical protein